MTARTFALLSICCSGAIAWAQDDPGLSESGAKPQDSPKSVKADSGDYRGVTPGGENLPPHPPPMPVKSGPQKMTWPGFQIIDGVPRVFLELTATPDYTVEAGTGKLVVTIERCEVPVRNNRRTLDVSYFNTHIKKIETKQGKKRGTHLVKITILTDEKRIPAHAEHTEPAAGGFQLLVIDLPKN